MNIAVGVVATGIGLSFRIACAAAVAGIRARVDPHAPAGGLRRAVARAHDLVVAVGLCFFHVFSNSELEVT